MKATVKDEIYIDSEVCPQCGSRAEALVYKGYPGEWMYKCPDCGHIEMDIDEFAEWMV
jgi:uncharacterized Zn finger protein